MVNYPNKKPIQSKKTAGTADYSNRGRNFENDITKTFDYYRSHEIALIYKRPTPIQVVKTFEHKVITEAYYEKSSTTDYNGIYRGRYIDIEAKETEKKNVFDFAKISSHQVDHLRLVLKFGGIAFILLYFKAFNEVFLVDAKVIVDKYFDDTAKHSLRYDEMPLYGTIVEQGFIPRLKLIEVIDKVYFADEEKIS